MYTRIGYKKKVHTVIRGKVISPRQPLHGQKISKLLLKVKRCTYRDICIEYINLCSILFYYFEYAHIFNKQAHVVIAGTHYYFFPDGVGRTPIDLMSLVTDFFRMHFQNTY